MNTRYITIAETIRDCRAILVWKKKNRFLKLRIIALSLDALAYLKSEKTDAEISHVWDILPMEDLIDDAYDESLRLSADWIAASPDQSSNFYEVATQSTLHLDVLMHSIAATRTAEALLEIIKKEGACYVAPPAQFSFYGSYFPGLQSLGRDNFIFKSVILQIIAGQGITYISISPLNTLLLSRLSWLRRWRVIKKLVYDISETIRSKLTMRVSIEKLLSGVSSVRLLSSGWGRDLSRMLDFGIFRKTLKAEGISHLDLVWRPKKVILPSEQAGQDEQYLLVRENTVRGVAYGPQVSIFRLSFWFSYLRFFRQVLRPRLQRAQTLFFYNGLRELFSYNIIFSYREAFLTRELLLPMLAKSSPKIFLGSDSGGVSARAELLTAKELGIRTLSTPHGYQAYVMPRYSYLADTVLTHSPATAEILSATGVASERIMAIGSSHMRRAVAPAIDQRSVRIVIGTRSWGGAWTNFASRHDLYDKELRTFVTEVLKNFSCNIVIKSHPNGDYHEYYDFLVSSFSNPRFRHIPKGWKVEQFADSTDILVCFGEMPSLYISALYLKIPIVFITGTMTKTQGKLNYDYKGLGSVVKGADEAVNEVKKIATDPLYYAEVMKKQNEFALRYDMAEPEQKIVELIK